MDDLPLVSEIREARQRLESVAGASEHLQRVESARMALSIVEAHQQNTPGVGLNDLPGDDVLGPIAERWTQLADLVVQGRASTPDRRVAARRMTLDALADGLRPLSADERRYAKQLHELRHDQHHKLKNPKYAEQMADVAHIASQRDEVYDALAPCQARLTAVAPSQTLIRQFADQLAWVHDAPPDANGVAAWRAAMIASSLLEVLHSCLEDTGFELPVPSVGALPDAPDPAVSDHWFHWTRTRMGEVQALGDALDTQATALKAEVDDLQDQLRQLNQTLQDHLG